MFGFQRHLTAHTVGENASLSFTAQQNTTNQQQRFSLMGERRKSDNYRRRMSKYLLVSMEKSFISGQNVVGQMYQGVFYLDIKVNLDLRRFVV